MISRKAGFYRLTGYQGRTSLCLVYYISDVCTASALLVQGGFAGAPPGFIALFFLSGALGLGLADIFLIKAFSLMGPGRTMMLFGFQPFLIGVISYFAFGQTLEPRKAAAVLFFIVCLYIFSLESFRKRGHWNVKASLFALGGILLDGTGVVITRYCFNNTPGISTTEGNFYRAAGAMLLFAALSRLRPFHFVEKLRTLGGRNLFWLGVGSVMGTYLSLMFYLNAVRHAGALAAVSGIAITGTLFASIFECAVERKRPSSYLAVAFVFFLAGMALLFG